MNGEFAREADRPLLQKRLQLNRLDRSGVMKAVSLGRSLPKPYLLSAAFRIGHVRRFRKMNFTVREYGQAFVDASFNFAPKLSSDLAALILRWPHAFACGDNRMLI